MKRITKVSFMLGFLVLCIFGQTAFSSNGGLTTQEETIGSVGDAAGYKTPGRSVQEFLTPEGRFDLKAARMAGYQDPLDLSDFDVLIDPASGQPLIRPSNGTAIAGHPDDICWKREQDILGTDGPVYALTMYGGRLIVAGHFDVVCDTVAHNIAAWGGTSWSALGLGMNDVVYSLTVYDNQLVAGGYFTAAGGVSVSYIAAWDGNSWSALGSGMSADVRALAVYEDLLIAGGYFTTAGGVSASRIAAWDGDSWSSLGSGMNDAVYALAVYDNRLISGGEFTTSGSVPASFIAAWDGASWSALGSGMNDDVDATIVYDNNLIAGGWFTTAGGDSANYIATWDGTSWSPMGSGVDNWGEVYALAVYDNKLIAGGTFLAAGGMPAHCIASWDGFSWSALGLGVNNWVCALAVYDNKLIAGGYFFMAGDVSANHIASWDGISWSALESETNVVLETSMTNSPVAFALSQNYPNPFNPSTEIRYDIPKKSHVSLKIHNIMGQEVKTLVEADQQVGNYIVTWECLDDQGREVSAGIYFCTLNAGDFSQTRKMVLIK